MSTRGGARVTLLLVLAAAGACEKPEFVPPDPAERAAEAEAAYRSAVFDTVAWTSTEERLLTGNQVFGAHCRRCHGPFGEGDTPYAREWRLEVPSLVEPEWEYAGDLDAVRRRTFTGHPPGMPVWGIGGISPREIDAVSFYILEQLRRPAGSPASAHSQPEPST
jgi:mono/diheme cytochrome c family protein